MNHRGARACGNSEHDPGDGQPAGGVELGSASAKRDMVALVPQLRAFARGLTGDVGRADELVEEAVVTAALDIMRLRDLANWRVWMFKILRDVFYRDVRAPASAGRLKPSSNWAAGCRVVRVMFPRLSAQHREILTLINGAQCSYEEAAQICGRTVERTKGRMREARACLTALIDAGAKRKRAARPRLAAPLLAPSSC